MTNITPVTPGHMQRKSIIPQASQHNRKVAQKVHSWDYAVKAWYDMSLNDVMLVQSRVGTMQ
ncbi:hypothetical protein BA188_07320 [Aeromonas hydrophila]|nr:hypothetical protein OI72_02805 [Aeromonas hydrophila]OFC43518.1 hypothetical protein BA189_03865 [Aeromonas hydrophila]OFC54602.1 hypothetical protein BA188_07320 [Aeromonas hydrophila]